VISPSGHRYPYWIWRSRSLPSRAEIRELQQIPDPLPVPIIHAGRVPDPVLVGEPCADCRDARSLHFASRPRMCLEPQCGCAAYRKPDPAKPVPVLVEAIVNPLEEWNAAAAAMVAALPVPETVGEAIAVLDRLRDLGVRIRDVRTYAGKVPNWIVDMAPLGDAAWVGRGRLGAWIRKR
jgi:hypothetical protein